jgi:hypothetical protein
VYIIMYYMHIYPSQGETIKFPHRYVSRKQSRWKRIHRYFVSQITFRISAWCTYTLDMLSTALAQQRKIRPNRRCNTHRSNGVGPFHLRGVRIHSRQLLLCGLLSHVSKGIVIPNNDQRDTVACSNESKGGNCHYSSFDTDSKPIKIDNCSTRTMSGCRNDFITDTLIQVQNKSVRGYAGTCTPITHQGTIHWRVADDNGTTRDIIIPNSYYVPTSTTRLLSPQHLAQQMKDNYPMKRGTWCATYEDSICLQWNQRTHSITVPLDPNSSNVGTIWTVPGYSRYH